MHEIVETLLGHLLGSHVHVNGGAPASAVRSIIKVAVKQFSASYQARSPY